jgi:hypothetical protein
MNTTIEKESAPPKPEVAVGGDSLDRLVRESRAYDDTFLLSCSICGKASPLMEWTETKIHGPLPLGTYQCPACSAAFRRQWNPKKDYGRGGVECAPVEARL